MPIVMIDWKNCRSLDTRAFYEPGKPRAMGTSPVTAHMEHCKHSQYSLQLNIYRWMLERSYNVEVTSMALVNFQPDRSGDYRMFPVRRMDVDAAMQPAASD